MKNKTKKILFYVGAALIIVGAAIGIIIDVNGGVEPDEVVAEMIDTTTTMDTIPVDTVVMQ